MDFYLTCSYKIDVLGNVLYHDALHLDEHSGIDGGVRHLKGSLMATPCASSSGGELDFNGDERYEMHAWSSRRVW